MSYKQNGTEKQNCCHYFSGRGVTFMSFFSSDGQSKVTGYQKQKATQLRQSWLLW